MTFSLFCQRLKMTHFGPNWAKFDPNLGILVVKNVFIFFPSFTKMEKIILGKKSTFHHFYPLHDLPLPTQILFIFWFLSKNRKKNISVEKLCHFGPEMGHTRRIPRVSLFDKFLVSRPTGR